MHVSSPRICIGFSIFSSGDTGDAPCDLGWACNLNRCILAILHSNLIHLLIHIHVFNNNTEERNDLYQTLNIQSGSASLF